MPRFIPSKSLGNSHAFRSLYTPGRWDSISVYYARGTCWDYRLCGITATAGEGVSYFTAQVVPAGLSLRRIP